MAFQGKKAEEMEEVETVEVEKVVVDMEVEA